MSPLVDRVVEEFKSLPDELQWRVYEFARSLAASAPQGAPGRQLLRFAGAISSDDLRLRQQAIEADCEMKSRMVSG